MNSKGIFSLFTEFTEYGVGIFGFLLYQGFGVLVVIAVILYLLAGNMHIWCMINLSINGRLKRFWQLLYRITNPFASSHIFFIGFSFFMHSISFFLLSGIFANLISISR